MRKNRLKLVNTIQIIIFTSLLLLAASMVVLEISKYRLEFKNQSELMRMEYLDQQKTLIKKEVERVTDLINYEKIQSINIARSNIKYRIDEAYAIALHIYQNNVNLHSDEEIQKMILCALRPIKFDLGKGYFFITHLDGTEVLFSDKPEIEGLNILDIRDTEGNYVIRDMINIIKENEEGYYEYFWTKPNETGNDHKKIAYIKSLGFYDWFIGTGVYVEDIEDSLQNTIGNYVTRYRFGKQNQDYVFVLDLIDIEGGKNFAIMYANANRPDIIGEYISDDYKDANGKEFRKEVLEGLRTTGECFVNYWYKKIEDSEPSPKISYFKLSNDKNFIVAAGVYLDDVEASITDLQLSLRNKLKFYILNTIFITSVLLFLILFVTYFVTQKLLSDFSLFSIFFNQSINENKEIDLSKIRFENLYTMAKSANTMLREKKEAKQHVLDEKEQLAVTLRSIGDAVITVNLESKIILVNRVAENLTGWSESDAKGKPLDEVFTIINANSRKAVKNPVNKVLKREITASLEENTILISKNKEEYNIEDSAAPIKTADSSVIGAVLVFRDVTEQIKRDQNLIKAKKLESVGVLAGGIAHDFNNLLTGLYGNIQMAKIHLSTHHDSYKYLDSAEHSMDRATNLTNQLLTFARGGDPVIENISIATSIVEIAEFSLRGSKIKLQSNIDTNLWMVKADKGQLSQVISNLIINAHQSMPNGGEITIGAENSKTENGKYIKITIQDEGEGIEYKNIDKIFDPYFSTKQLGSGLGLASTYSIIKKHNGKITVNSDPGKGTLFTIYLPAAENTQNPDSNLLNKEINTFHLSAKILVLDDEEIVRNVIGAMLSKMGYTISFALNGQEAVQKYKTSFERNDPFNIIITDLTIPGGMGGEKAAAEILTINPKAKIIVSSGYATDPIMANYEAFGFMGIAVKPYNFIDLQKEIERVLEI